MAVSHSKLARRFAQRISKAFTLSRFRKGIRNEVLQNHEDIAKETRKYLNEFLKAQAPNSVPRAQFDWEGMDRKGSDQDRAYPVVGIWTFPDAAVLAPFKCAFEFDHEAKSNSVKFKEALMKASVHVLSGYYEACVFVYILRRESDRPKYLDDGSPHTTKLVRALNKAGLYVTLVRMEW